MEFECMVTMKFGIPQPIVLQQYLIQMLDLIKNLIESIISMTDIAVALSSLSKHQQTY